MRAIGFVLAGMMCCAFGQAAVAQVETCATSQVAYRLPECTEYFKAGRVGVAPRVRPMEVAPPSIDAPMTPPRLYKMVDPADVRATPRKWRGRDIAFNGVNVYWVENDDVRFITRTSLTLFARSVTGSTDLTNMLRQNCETTKEAFSTRCRVNVRFSYEDFDEDSPSGFSNRTVLRAAAVEVVRPARR